MIIFEEEDWKREFYVKHASTNSQSANHFSELVGVLRAAQLQQQLQQHSTDRSRRRTFNFIVIGHDPLEARRYVRHLEAFRCGSGVVQVKTRCRVRVWSWGDRDWGRGRREREAEWEMQPKRTTTATTTQQSDALAHHSLIAVHCHQTAPSSLIEKVLSASVFTPTPISHIVYDIYYVRGEIK